jgi:sigma-E factor negative regulatory protein RseB
VSVPFGQFRRDLGRIGFGAIIGLALLGGPTGVPAQAAGSTSLSAAEAGPWLARIQQAATNSNYHGTLMFSAGGVMSTSRVTHICEGRQRYERIEVLDGQARLQYRHNEQLMTLWPANKLARIEQRDAVAEFPALPMSASAQALENYDIGVLPRERIAGREVDVLWLKPHDKHRFAQRFWADRETGLLLRNDVIGAGGEVLESSAFSDIKIGSKQSPEAVLGPMKQLEGYRVQKPLAERAQVEAEGWTLVRQVPGFTLVSCTKRPLAAATESGSPVPVLQSVFSDGLTHVSVFIEPYDAQRHKQPMGSSLGATHSLMNRHGDWWFTVVGEVPMATVQQFEALFERKR